MSAARPAVLALRSLAAVCLALTALGLPERSPFAPPRAVLVLDDSPSVRRRFPGFAEKTVGLWKSFQGGANPVVGADDLPAALRVASALAPPRVETRILLATDGLARGDDFEADLRALRERGARVFALTPPAPVPLARAVAAVLPERVFIGEPFTVRGRILASRPGPVTVRLSRSGEAAGETTVIVDAAGSADAEFPQELDRVGRVRYALDAGTGFPPAAGEVSVAESPRVLWLSEDPGASGPLVALLRAAGVELEIAHPGDLLSPAQELARAEVIVLDDLSAPVLTDELAAGLRRAVGERGAGLVVLGGRKGLGSGEYASAGIEAMLPVTAGFSSPPPPEKVAMVIAMDTSFSMAYRGRGAGGAHGSEPRKIDVAKESARGVVRIVRAGDRLGILGNSTDIFWIAPLGEITDEASLLEGIDAVRPVGDGIYFYSVLNEAREALSREAGGVRHVLVLCDAEDIDQYEVAGRGHSFDLLRQMSQEGMTVSILAIGSPTDKDVPFLRTAALLGRGDFYLVQRILALPRYFVSEYRRISSARNFLEEDVQAITSDPSAPGAGGAFPGLGGIALVTAREGSRTLLQTSVGAPLLVAGAYGRGRVSVFAGDNGYLWAKGWVESESMRRFWLQVLFGAAPAGERDRGFASLLDADRAAGRLRFHYAGREAALPPWGALWAIPAAGEPGEPQKLERVGLRAYRGAAPLGEEGYRRVIVAEDREGTRPLLTGGYAIPPAAEDLPSPARWDRVERALEATGGGWVDGPDEMAAADGLGGRLTAPWAVLFIAAGVLLLLAEVVVRTFGEE